MANNITLQNTTLASLPLGIIIATEDLGSNVHIQKYLQVVGGNPVSTSNPCPVWDADGSITVDGQVSVLQSGSWSVAQSGTWNVNASQVGTWNIAITSVGVTSLVPGANSTTLGKSANGAYAVGDVGVAVLGVRSNVGVSFVGANGAYSPLSLTPNGAMRVCLSEQEGNAVGRVPVEVSSSGNTTLVSAVSGKKIRVTGAALIANGAVNIRFMGSSNLTGTYYVTNNAGFVLPYHPDGWFETSATNTALVIVLSASVPVGGVLTYEEV